MWKGFFWHLKSGACFSKVSKNSKISNLMINEPFFFFFIYSFWMKRSSLQTRIFRHIYPLFLCTDYETFTGLLRKGPFHHKVTLKQEWYRTWQTRSNSRIRIKVLRRWCGVSYLKLFGIKRTPNLLIKYMFKTFLNGANISYLAWNDIKEL